MNVELQELVQRYLAAAGTYGKQAPLGSLGLAKKEIEDAFSAFDEDYHVSRFFQFSCAAGPSFQINGFPQTHVTIDAEVQSIL